MFKNQRVMALLRHGMTHRMTHGIFAVCALIVAQACSSPGELTNAPEELYRLAEKNMSDQDYMFAREKFRDLKNRFPYSTRAIDAELRIADAYFLEELYVEAESAYDIFRDLHPSHPQNEYVSYQIALCHFHQIPDDIARDLSPAHNAILSIKEFQKQYPNSKFKEDAAKRLAQVRKALAEHERYVGNFYFNKEQFLSASYRYATLLKDFPNLGFEEEALYRLGQCYYHIRMFANARDALQRLLKEFPQGLYRSDAESLLQAIAEKV